MTLRPLALSVSLRAHTADAATAAPASGRTDEAGHCAFCGGVRGRRAVSGDDRGAPPACALCLLVLHLDRPRIDHEAMLIWLPEMSQPALNVLMRGIQSRLRALGETLRIDATPALDGDDRPWLYHAQQALLARRDAAAGRLGTSRPSELADALLRLAAPLYARRSELLAGIRLLAAGQFFDGDTDILPQIVDGWRAQSPVPATRVAA